MARDFRDFSEELTGGSEKIQRGLEGVVSAARGADSAHSGLSSAQENAAETGRDLARAQREVATSLGMSSRLSTGATKGMVGISNLSRKAATSVKGLSAEFSTLSSDADAAGMSVSTLGSEIDTVSGSRIDIKVNTEEIDKGIKSTKSILDKFSGSTLDLDLNTKGVDKSLNKDVKSMFDKFDAEIDLSVKVVVDANKELDKLKAESEALLKEMEDFEIQMNLPADAWETFDEVRDKAGKVNDKLDDTEEKMRKVLSVSKSGGTNFLKGDIDNVDMLIEELTELEGVKTRASRAKFIALSIERGQLQAIDDFANGLDVAKRKIFEARVEKIGLEKAVAELASSYPVLVARMQKAAAASEQVARTSDTLSRELDKQGDALDLLRDKYNEGVQTAEDFFGGIGASQGILVGAGVAVAFLGTKLAELIGEFQDSALEIAKFNLELDAIEIGPDLIDTQGIRREVGLTRDEALEFFEVLEGGVSQGIISVNEFVAAAGALEDTFGDDQLDRLQQYVGLLEQLPDIESDLEIGANFDDQAAALFALAQEGKVQTLIDLQASGLAGGIQLETSKEEVGLLNAAESADMTVQRIEEQLIKSFPTWGPQFTAIAGGVAKGVAVLAGGVAGIAALKIFFGRGQEDIREANVDTKKAVDGASDDIVSAINKQESSRTRRGSERGRSGRSGGGGGKDSKIDNLIETYIIQKVIKKFGGKIGNQVARRGAGRMGVRAAAAAGGKIGGRGGAMAAARIATSLKAGDYVKTAKAVATLGKTSISTSGALAVAGKGIFKFAKSGFGVGLALEGAGFLVDKASGLFGDATKEADAAIVKFTGGMLSAAGTIVGFASLGSIIPGVGTAIGAVVGAVVAAPGLILSGFDTLGTVAQDVGDRLSGTFESLDGRPIQKYNGTITKAGLVIKEFGIALKDNVQGVKDGFSNLWQSTKETAQGLGLIVKENAKYLRFLPGVGLAIDAFTTIPNLIKNFGDAIQGPEAAAELAKIKRASQQLDDSLNELSKTTKRVNAAEARELRRIQEVALSLQKELGKTKATFEGIKFSLADLNKEIASAELDIFNELGGTVAGFDSALESSGNAVREKFGQVNKALDVRRAAIISNSKLDANARKQALDDLYKRELSALAEFAAGINDLVKKFSEAPDILISEFKEQAREAEFDFDIEGGVDQTQFFEGVKAEFDATSSLFSRGLEQQSKAVQELAKTQEDLKRTAEETNKVFNEEFPKFGDTVKKVLGDAVKETESGGFELVQENAPEALERVNKSLKEVNEQIEQYEAQINGLNVDRITQAYNAAADEQALAANSAKNVQEEIGNLKEEASKLVKKGKDTTEISKKIAEKSKEQQDFITKANQAAEEVANQQDAFSSVLRKAGLSTEEIQAAWTAITNRQGLANGSLRDAKKAVDETVKLQGESLKSAQERRKLLDGEKDQLVKARGIVGASANAVKNNVQAEKLVSELRKELVTRAEEQREAVKALTQIVEATTKDQERAAAAAQFQASAASLTGDAIKESEAAFEANTALLRAQIDAAASGLEEAKAREAQLKEEAEQYDRLSQEAKNNAKKARDAGRELEAVQLEESAKVYEQGAKRTATNAKNAAQAAADLQSEAKNAQESLLESLTDVSGALSEFEGTLSGRRIAAEFDFSDALMEAARFSDDFEAITAQGLAVTVETAKREAQLRRRAVAERAAALEREAEETAKALAARGDVAGAKNFLLEQKATVEAQKRAEFAKIETQQKRKVLDDAKRAADLAREAIGIEEDLIDAQTSFLSEVGGSFENVLALQNQAVGLEREKLRLAEEELQVARQTGATGVELREREAAVIKQQLNLRKKEFGVQKDIFEQIVGKAFGQLRSDFGARKQRFSEVGLLGVEGSRVRRSSGIRTGGPAQTIGERAAARQLAGGFDRGTARGGIIGAATRGGALGQAPKKSTEEKIFGAAKDSAEFNKTTSEKITSMSDASTNPGSIYTNDQHLGAKLDILIKILSGKSVGEEEIAEATEEAGQMVADAARDGTAAGAVASSVEGLKQVQKKQISEQLKIARKDLNTSLATLQEAKASGDEKVFTKAASETEGKLNQVLDLEQSVREQEIRNPIAGAFPQVAELGRILSGGLPEQAKEFDKLVSVEQEAAGKAKETESKKQDLAKKQRAIAEGRGGPMTAAKQLGGTFMGIEGPATAAAQLGGTFMGIEGPMTAQAQLDAMNESRRESGPEAMPGPGKIPDDQLTPVALALRKATEAGLAEESGGVKAENLGVGLTQEQARAAASQFEQNAYQQEASGNLEGAAVSREAAESIWKNMEEGATVASQTAVAAPNKTAVPEQTISGSERDAATNRSRELGAVAAQAPQTSFATVAGVGGAAAGVGGAASPTMKIQGELLVRFNNNFFRDSMATLVGEVINSAEIVDKLSKSLQDRGFLKQN